MKSFKTYLIEGRDAPLYHGTAASFAEKILEGNVLVGMTNQVINQKSLMGVSLSRKRDVARSFAGVSGVIFQLDQRKLAQNYRILPINFFASGINSAGNAARDPETLGAKHVITGNEYEEFVVGDIRNLNRYITKIEVLDPDVLKRGYNSLAYHPKLFMNGKFVNEY